ncbi:MAG: DUF1080 domain-containing protein, partial [Lentisphaeria bacterium]|nr:DUF1080 domain-containing protein [Lentisphaeria bacterium]
MDTHRFPFCPVFRLTAAALLPVACGAEGVGSDPGVSGLPFAFFAMDTGTRDAAHGTPESQAAMLRELGYAGMDHSGTAGIEAKLRALDAVDLRLFAVYVGAWIDGGDGTVEGLEGAVEALRGRGTRIWLTLRSRAHRASAPEGDMEAAEVVRRVADVAARGGLEVALYPHTGFWLERVEDAVRVARASGRSNVGVTFNLCHWLRVTGGQVDPGPVLGEVLPWLYVVTVNGADGGGADWKALIQTLDRGTYDVGRVLGALRDLGYLGPVGLQGYGIGGDAAGNLGRSMGAWRRYGERMAKEWRDLSAEGLAGWQEPTGEWREVGVAAMRQDDGRSLSWEEGRGVLVNGPSGRTVNLVSAAVHGDVQVHIEFMVPRGSNSGVYLQGRYEVQVLDSWGVAEPGPGDCGGVYQRWDPGRRPPGFEGSAPRLNASRPPGEWQSFDVIFRAPRFDARGVKREAARFVRVWHNGSLVQSGVAVSGPTRAARFETEAAEGPLMLQGDHGPVAYRNLRLRAVAVSHIPGSAALLEGGWFDRLGGYRFGDSREVFSELEVAFRGASVEVRAILEGRLGAILGQPETTVDCRRELCEILRAWGTPRSLPVLMSLSADSACAEHAWAALLTKAWPEVDAFVMDQLRTQGNEPSGQLLAAAGLRRIEAAVPYLAELAAGADGPVLRGALAALGAVGSEAAAEALEGFRGPETSRACWLDACLVCGERLVEAGRAGVAARLYGHVLDRPGVSGAGRAAALRGLAVASPERAFEVARGELDSTDGDMRLAAAQVLTEHPGADALGVLLARAQEASTAERRVWVPLLAGLSGHSGAGAARGGIAEVLVRWADEAEDDAVRLAATAALAQAGGAAQVLWLARQAAGEGTIGRAAAMSLERMEGEDVDEAIRSNIPAVPAEVQAVLIEALATRRGGEAVPELVRLAGTEAPGVRDASLKALGRVASGAEACTALLGLLALAPDAESAERVADAVFRVARRIESRGERMRVLFAGVPAASIPRACFLRLLAEFGGAEAYALAAGELEGGPELRAAALRALCAWPDGTPLLRLRELATTAEDAAERRLARRGFVRAVGLREDLDDEERVGYYREALDAADSRGEKVAVLQALGEVPDPRVLPLLRVCLADPALVAEARLALLGALRLGGPRCPSLAREVGQAPAAVGGEDAGFAAQRKEILDWIAGFQGHITAWHVSPAYPGEGRDPFPTVFPPEEEPGGVPWSFH